MGVSISSALFKLAQGGKGVRKEDVPKRFISPSAVSGLKAATTNFLITPNPTTPCALLPNPKLTISNLLNQSELANRRESAIECGSPFLESSSEKG